MTKIVKSETKILAEGTVIVALSVILKDVLPPIYHLPQGGSVSVAGMVPLLWFLESYCSLTPFSIYY